MNIRSLTIIFFLLMLNGVAQKAVCQDSAEVILREAPIYPPNYDFRLLYIIDGKPNYTDNLRKDLVPDTSDILDIEVLKGKEATTKYGKTGNNGVVIITSKQFARKTYQKKLSAFSEGYKKYIAKHGNDHKLLYVLNNTILHIDKKGLMELYYLQPGDIKKVTFKSDNGFANDATVVIITNEDTQ